MSISHDETMVQGPVAYMQCALLYTSSSGERRIRSSSQPHHMVAIPSYRAVLHQDYAALLMGATKAAVGSP